MFQYDMLARSLAAGNGFRWYAPADAARLAPYIRLDVPLKALDPQGTPTTFRAPLYPGFVSLIYILFGSGESRFFAVRVAQAALGATLAPMTYGLARQVLGRGPEEMKAGDEQGSARMAAVIISVYPTLVLYPLALATENLCIPLVLGSVIAVLSLADPSASGNAPERRTQLGFGRSILAGLLLGLAALTRSVILPFAVLAVIWIWLVAGRLRSAVLVAGVLVATVVPWIVRNSLLEGRMTGIETSMGYNLYVGYHPQSTGTFIFGPSLDLLSILDDRTRDLVGAHKALAFIEADPLRFPYLAARRLGYFFGLEWRAFTYFYVNNFMGALPATTLGIILTILGLPFIFVSLSAARGVAAIPSRPTAILMAMLFIGYVAPHVLILSEERFHLALLPFLAVLAGAAKATHWRDLKLRPLALAVVLVTSALLIVNWGSELVRDWPTLVRMFAMNGNQLYLPY